MGSRMSKCLHAAEGRKALKEAIDLPEAVPEYHQVGTSSSTSEEKREVRN
jgi:hypothetical protein